MTDIAEEATVINKSKEGKEEKVFDALEWPRQKDGGIQALTAMCSHVPRENRWSGIMAITAMCPEANGKNKTRMDIRILQEVYPTCFLKLGGQFRKEKLPHDAPAFPLKHKAKFPIL